MRVKRTMLALGALWAASLSAQPALAQQDAGRIGQSDARESWHEARRRQAADRRAALLEWHRARRVGFSLQEDVPALLPERGTLAPAAPALQGTSLERRSEPSIVALPESHVRVLAPLSIREHESGERGFAHERFDRDVNRFDHDRYRFDDDRDRFGHDRRRFDHEWRWDEFRHDPWGAWARPYSPFDLPYGFEDLVCVARVRGAGPRKPGPYGHADRIRMRATCRPSFDPDYGWAPYGPIGDPRLHGFPYRAAPLPAPHRFSHRFFPSASALPWGADDVWLPDEDGIPGFEGLFR